MEEFKYTPLNLDKPAIRLLRLHPGNGGVISCSLILAELHQRDTMVSYEALSYTWGSPNLTAIIYVNGCCLRVTHNLYQALLDLRYQEQERFLWIDAVCIDQKNKKERGHQVAQMGDIYKGADRVIFRLGPGSDATNAFMESLQWLQKESIKHACKAWSPQDDRWKNFWISFQPVSGEIKVDLENLQRQGLQEILEQPWFRRVWILQEVAFAKAGIISCGTRSVSARLFSLTPLLLRVIPDAHCQSVLDIMPSLWREFTWWSESRSLYRLLLNFGRSEATEPRDLIYALRGMSSDMEDKTLLVPDYEKAENALIDDVIRYIYYSDLKHLTWWPRPTSIRELLRDLPTLGTSFCMEIGKQLLPPDMEMLLRNPEILVSQEMIKAAAQYDKAGEVVEVLLRCRGGEFKIDEEVLICAATNLIGAKNVLEAFWRYQDQLVVTERILIAAAENLTSGDSAMRFLLPLNWTQDYDITPVLEAVARNRSEYSKAEMIRILLGKKDNNIATISELLVAAAEIQYYGSCILEHFVQELPCFEIAEHAIIAAMKNWRGGVDCLQLLLRYCTSYVTITEGIIQAAYDSPDHGFNAIKLLLGNPAVYWRLSPDQRVAALVQISDKASVQHPNPWETLAQEIVDESSAYCRELTLGLLLEGKEGLFDEDTVSSILKRYGTRVIEDLFILRRKQAIISKTCVLVLLQEIKAEEAEWSDMERKYASRTNASQFKSNEEEQYWVPWIRSDEGQRSRKEKRRIWMPLLRQILSEHMTDKERSTWRPLLPQFFEQGITDSERSTWRPSLPQFLTNITNKERRTWRPLLPQFLERYLPYTEQSTWRLLLPQFFEQDMTDIERSTWGPVLLQVFKTNMTVEEQHIWRRLLPQFLRQSAADGKLSAWRRLLRQFLEQPMTDEELTIWRHLLLRFLCRHKADIELSTWRRLLPRFLEQPMTNRELRIWRRLLPRFLEQPMIERELSAWRRLLPQFLKQPVTDGALNTWRPLLPRFLEQPMTDEEQKIWKSLLPQLLKN